MGDIFSSTRVTAHTFRHINPLPLVHRPKGTLLVIIRNCAALQKLDTGINMRSAASIPHTIKWGYFNPFFLGFCSITNIIDSTAMIKYCICVKHNVLRL